MEYIKKLVKSIIPVLKYMLFSYLVIFISFIIYGLMGNHDVEKFITNYSVYILLIFNFIYSIYLLKKHNIHYKKPNNIIPLFILGIGLSCFCNMIILSIKVNEITSFSMLLLIISGVIVGPLSEEIVFRGILLNNLSKYNNKLVTILLGSFIFGLMHRGIINIIYAFVLGIVLSVIYLKERNLSNCTIVHAAANLIVLFLTGYNVYILLLSFILLVISVSILKRDYLLK